MCVWLYNVYYTCVHVGMCRCKYMVGWRGSGGVWVGSGGCGGCGRQHPSLLLLLLYLPNLTGRRPEAGALHSSGTLQWGRAAGEVGPRSPLLGPRAPAPRSSATQAQPPRLGRGVRVRGRVKGKGVVRAGPRCHSCGLCRVNGSIGRLPHPPAVRHNKGAACGVDPRRGRALPRQRQHGRPRAPVWVLRHGLPRPEADPVLFPRLSQPERAAAGQRGPAHCVLRPGEGLVWSLDFSFFGVFDLNGCWDVGCWDVGVECGCTPPVSHTPDNQPTNTHLLPTQNQPSFLFNRQQTFHWKAHFILIFRKQFDTHPPRFLTPATCHSILKNVSSFLTTLVALHFTPLLKSLCHFSQSHSFEQV